MQRDRSIASTLVLTSLAIISLARAPASHGQEAVQVPDASDWTRRGVALAAGPEGTWDVRLYGQISPGAVVKRNGTYFLYYIGADGDRSTDGGPRHRALGVATSEDGIKFTKHETNPILTHVPHKNEEEGIFSVTTTPDSTGRIRLFYTAIWARNSTTESVRSYVALAESENGIDLDSRGYIVDWNDPDVWGHGDELIALGPFHAGGRWHCYYIAKGGEGLWILGLASGDSPTDLKQTRPVLTDGDPITGGGSLAFIGQDRLALFLVRDRNKDARQSYVEVRTASVHEPGELSEPVASYAFKDARHTAVFLDREKRTWFMYQRPNRGNRIVVRSAPARVAEDKPQSE